MSGYINLAETQPFFGIDIAGIGQWPSKALPLERIKPVHCGHV
jgi:hypothetical protein